MTRPEGRRPRDGRAFVTGYASAGWAALGLVVALAALSVPVGLRPARPPGVAGVDGGWLGWMLATRSAPLDGLARACDAIWAGPVYVGLCLVAVAVLLIRRRPLAAAYIVVTVVVASRIGALMKIVIGRPRPPLTDRLFPAHELAFPSGHSVDAAALVTAVVLLAVAARPAVRWPAVAVGAALVALAMWSRVYAGVHWLSDTVAGALLGTATALALWCAAGAWTHHRDAGPGPGRGAAGSGR